MSGPQQPAPQGSFQRLIEDLYYDRDAARGVPGTLLWFVEEVGELVRAVRRKDKKNLEEEFSDVYAWLATLASLHGLDLEQVARKKYGEWLPTLPRRAVPVSAPDSGLTASSVSTSGPVLRRRRESRAPCS
jgi:NTP pyrophosphatase (non-canonical NTP hydrolase)